MDKKIIQKAWDLHYEAYKNFDNRNSEQSQEFYRGQASAFLQVYELLTREVLACEHLNEDGSCGEPDYAWCLAWTNWNHEHPGREAPEFCKLPKKERDKYE